MERAPTCGFREEIAPENVRSQRGTLGKEDQGGDTFQRHHDARGGDGRTGYEALLETEVR